MTAILCVFSLVVGFALGTLVNFAKNKIDSNVYGRNLKLEYALKVERLYSEYLSECLKNLQSERNKNE